MKDSLRHPEPVSPIERARDHLANERTFLAWLRTALAIVALGALLARLTASEGGTTTAAAAIVVTCGVGVLVYGTARYYRVARDLEAGEFHAARRSPLLVTIAVILTAAVVVPLLLV
jgi:putative membrane protein